jgi:protein gp37
MSTATKIKWTRGNDGTAECSDVSEGCLNCYARTFAQVNNRLTTGDTA